MQNLNQTLVKHNKPLYVTKILLRFYKQNSNYNMQNDDIIKNVQIYIIPRVHNRFLKSSGTFESHDI